MLNQERLKSRKLQNESAYNEAMLDLLSVLNISGPEAKINTQKSISKILSYFGEETPEIPEDIKDFGEQIEFVLRPSGMMKRRVELVGSWWLDATGVLLASKKSGEIVVMFPGKWSGYYYLDKKGKKININSKNSKDFNLYAFCFYRPFTKNSMKIVDLVKFMIKNISSSDFIFLILVYLIVQLLGMAVPYITSIIYNTLVPSESIPLLQTISCTLLGLTVGKSSIRIIQSFVKSRLKGKLNLSIYSAVMMKLFSLPVSFFKKYSAGDLASRVGYINILCRTISETFLSTLLTTFFSLGYIFQMFYHAKTMVVSSVLIIFSSLCFSIIITILKQNINAKKLRVSTKLQSLVFNIFTGMQKIKIAGAEKRAFAVWAKKYSEAQKLEYSPPTILKISGVIGMIISSVGNIILYWIATKTNISVANYMAFNVAYGSVSGAMSSLSGVAMQFANLIPSVDLIKPFLETETENSSKGKIIDSLSGNIEINNVVFRYQKDQDPVLNNLSLKIEDGEYVAIVGKTGCGKSTIMRLLLGFEIPEKGNIYYDNRGIETLDKKSLRQKIGVVMQNGAIFQGDIFSNITVTAPWKTMDDAWEAAHMAGLDKDIESFPMGMHTLISEGSGGISGGQKQRLMIARALITKPKILFFDEATSALDNITQKIVSDNIDKLKCTRIVIAHRLSTIKNCDRILVIDKGQICESGDYNSLMEQKNLFYQLAMRQLAN